tara:strand:- start:3132 stop:3443 length:312 start_codon:yes stop_codon:yes gene_type:complete
MERNDKLQKALGHFNLGIHQWWGWKDLEKPQTYNNVELLDETATMPTEEEVNAKIAELTVIENRQNAYASIPDQLDMQYWDSVNGTTTWNEHIDKVKADNPKS